MKSWKSIAFLGLHTWWQPKCSFGNCRHTRWHRKGSQELDKRTQWLDDLWYSNTNAWAAHEWQLSASVSDDCPIIPHSLIQFDWINVLLRLFYRFFFLRLLEYFNTEPTFICMRLIREWTQSLIWTSCKGISIKNLICWSENSIFLEFQLVSRNWNYMKRRKIKVIFVSKKLTPEFQATNFFLLINCIIW